MVRASLAIVLLASALSTARADDVRLVCDATLTFSTPTPRNPVAVARALGGSLVGYDSWSVTVRVPTAAFQAALVRAGAFGEIVHRDVFAADAADDLRVLRDTLQRAIEARGRLVAHLQETRDSDESIRVEEAIADADVEIAELARALRTLSSRASFGTIALVFGHV